MEKLKNAPETKKLRLNWEGHRNVSENLLQDCKTILGLSQVKVTKILKRADVSIILKNIFFLKKENKNRISLKKNNKKCPSAFYRILRFNF